MDLHQIQIFAKIVELRSFSRAAEALHLTQPTISEHVRLLEDEIGGRLFDRLGRETVPTKAGELLYGYARRMLALHEETRRSLDQFLGRMSGGLSVGASTIPGEYVLPPLMGRFKEKYPEISVSLLIQDTQRILDLLLEGKVEMGVVGARIEHRALEYTELMPDELVLVVPATHPWHGRKTVTLAELSQEPLIIRERGSGSRHALERALTEAGVEWESLRIVGELGSTQAIKQAVKAGMGLSIISRRAVEEECHHGLLCCVRLKELRVSRHFYIVIHRERTRSPLCGAFLDFLRSSA
jgi:DNA-binding transcriptional LysR family regulator